MLFEELNKKIVQVVEMMDSKDLKGKYFFNKIFILSTFG
jgi:hypothetical protein